MFFTFICDLDFLFQSKNVKRVCLPDVKRINVNILNEISAFNLFLKIGAVIRYHFLKFRIITICRCDESENIKHRYYYY